MYVCVMFAHILIYVKTRINPQSGPFLLILGRNEAALDKGSWKQQLTSSLQRALSWAALFERLDPIRLEEGL